MMNESAAWPDFTLVLSVEQVLSAHPLCHDELQSRFPCRAGKTAQEFQERLQLGVNKVGKHHDQRLQWAEEEGAEISGGNCSINTWRPGLAIKQHTTVVLLPAWHSESQLAASCSEWPGGSGPAALRARSRPERSAWTPTCLRRQPWTQTSGGPAAGWPPAWHTTGRCCPARPSTEQSAQGQRRCTPADIHHRSGGGGVQGGRC